MTTRPGLSQASTKLYSSAPGSLMLSSAALNRYAWIIVLGCLLSGACGPVRTPDTSDPAVVLSETTARGPSESHDVVSGSDTATSESLDVVSSSDTATSDATTQVSGNGDRSSIDAGPAPTDAQRDAARASAESSPACAPIVTSWRSVLPKVFAERTAQSDSREARVEGELGLTCIPVRGGAWGTLAHQVRATQPTAPDEGPWQWRYSGTFSAGYVDSDGKLHQLALGPFVHGFSKGAEEPVISHPALYPLSPTKEPATPAALVAIASFSNHFDEQLQLRVVAFEADRLAISDELAALGTLTAGENEFWDDKSPYEVPMFLDPLGLPPGMEEERFLLPVRLRPDRTLISDVGRGRFVPSCSESTDSDENPGIRMGRALTCRWLSGESTDELLYRFAHDCTKQRAAGLCPHLPQVRARLKIAAPSALRALRPVQ